MIKRIAVAIAALTALVAGTLSANNSPSVVLEVSIPRGESGATATFTDHVVNVTIHNEKATINIYQESRDRWISRTNVTVVRPVTTINFHRRDIQVVLVFEPELTTVINPQHLPGIIHDNTPLVRKMQALALRQAGFSDEAILKAAGVLPDPGCSN